MLLRDATASRRPDCAPTRATRALTRAWGHCQQRPHRGALTAPARGSSFQVHVQRDHPDIAAAAGSGGSGGARRTGTLAADISRGGGEEPAAVLVQPRQDAVGGPDFDCTCTPCARARPLHAHMLHLHTLCTRTYCTCKPCVGPCVWRGWASNGRGTAGCGERGLGSKQSPTHRPHGALLESVCSVLMKTTG